MRFSEKMNKDNRSKYCPHRITIGNRTYMKVSAILHKGANKDSGHYTFVLADQLI